jgi:3-oxoadipate enol-lactonase
MSDIVKLHYSEAGQGTPVVLLHGFPLSSVLWHKQQRQLSDLSRVITPDLRGHGQSPARPGVYEMETLARDVLALLDSLHIRKAAILGHSMGGYVALAAWKLAAERFLALGLIDSQAAADTEEGRQGRFKLAEKVATEGSQAVAAAMLPKLFAPGLAAGDPLIEQVQQMILNTPRAGIIGSLNGMAVRHNATATLATIDVPALILTGDKDQLIPPARAEAMAAVIPKATLTIIENAGHLPMLERPDATATALCRFLSAVGD